MNIKNVKEENLCIQCGMCAAVCPKECISIEKSNYDYLPEINESKCIDCSLCSKICSKQFLGTKENQIDEDYLFGQFINIFHAKTKEADILKNSTSGGVITTLVKTLLENGTYDCAFLLNDYSYENQLKTRKFTKNDDLKNTSKSRYLTVSHHDSIKYIKENPNEKVILIATGCIISSFLELIKTLNLNRDNYLLIGLFCDKTMNYGVYEYFKQHKVSKNRNLKKLFFRTKDIEGWPGDVRLEYEDGTIKDLPAKERMKVKEYFMPERCLYCLDKLNKNSDISTGDNYIPENKDKEGISTVIIRSEKGNEIWNSLSEKFIFGKNNKESVIAAQSLKARINRNLQFSKIKGLSNGDYSPENKKEYSKIMHKIKIGQEKSLYSKIQKDILLNKLLYKILKL